MKQLLIEQDDNGGVNVTTNEEEMSVESAIFLLELARLNILSYYLGGEEKATSEPDIEDNENENPLP